MLTHMTDQEAQEFIDAQRKRFEELNVNGMTFKQRRRIRELDVISPEERAQARDLAARLPHDLGWPPHGDTGRMRVVNMETGEIQIKRAPARKLDFGDDGEYGLRSRPDGIPGDLAEVVL
jgi:hypothetical protein